MDLRSDGLHQDNAVQENSQKDLRSNRLHPENANKSSQDAQIEFPRLISIKSNQTNRCRENPVDSHQSDDDDDDFGYDTCDSMHGNGMKLSYGTMWFHAWNRMEDL